MSKICQSSASMYAGLSSKADLRPVTVELARRTPCRRLILAFRIATGELIGPPRHVLVDLGQLIGLLAARLFLVIS